MGWVKSRNNVFNLSNYFIIFYIGYVAATKQCKEYVALKGPGISAKPENHLFFRRLGPVIKRTLEKCERENGFM